MKKLRLILACLLAPIYTFAWHGNGHMTAGAIAYYYLKTNNPAVLQKVLATIKLHPWYNQKHWNDTLAMLPPDQQDVGLFMLASTYPDDAKQVRGSIDGDPTHHKWHFIDYTFVPPGQSILGMTPQSPNAKEKIDAFLTSIPNEGDSPQKAVDIAWFFHLIEDIHQPLHASSLFDQNHPHGDQGGNLTFYTFGNGSRQVLHSYWDDLVKGTVKTYANHAKQLLAMPQYKETNLPELSKYTSPDDWMAKESSPEAQQFAYLNGKVNGTKNNPTILDASYDGTAKKLGERRVVVAGIRLAKLLTKLYS